MKGFFISNIDILLEAKLIEYNLIKKLLNFHCSDLLKSRKSKNNSILNIRIGPNLLRSLPFLYGASEVFSSDFAGGLPPIVEGTLVLEVTSFSYRENEVSFAPKLIPSN